MEPKSFSDQQFLVDLLNLTPVTKRTNELSVPNKGLWNQLTVQDLGRLSWTSKHLYQVVKISDLVNLINELKIKELPLNLNYKFKHVFLMNARLPVFNQLPDYAKKRLQPCKLQLLTQREAIILPNVKLVNSEERVFISLSKIMGSSQFEISTKELGPKSISHTYIRTLIDNKYETCKLLAFGIYLRGDFTEGFNKLTSEMLNENDVETFLKSDELTAPYVKHSGVQAHKEMLKFLENLEPYIEAINAPSFG